MALVRKGIMVLALMSVIRLIQSCDICNCIDELTYDLSAIKIDNLDNSGERGEVVSVDTFSNEAVAFDITLSDSVISPVAICPNKSLTFGFTPTYACSCIENIEANQEVINITITTVYPVNNELAENADVTDQFLAKTDGKSPSSGLYYSIENIISRINKKARQHYRSLDFQIYYAGAIENNKAQFRISVELSDGRILSTTTRLLHLYKPGAAILN